MKEIQLGNSFYLSDKLSKSIDNKLNDKMFLTLYDLLVDNELRTFLNNNIIDALIYG
jgi:hypothetical protein